MKIKPTLLCFSGKYGSMLSLVLIETQNVPIPTIKIFKYNIMPVELYLPESFKSQGSVQFPRF